MSSDDLGPKVTGAGYLTPDLVGELADETASVIELSGAIKWFDVSKGYGFIIPDNGLPDVLLHVTCLRRDGYQTAYEGARVVCEVLQRPKAHDGGRSPAGQPAGALSAWQSSDSALSCAACWALPKRVSNLGLTVAKPGHSAAW